jgi:GR25 family glycosyltransferase involved in LPS biosynthesis
MIQSYLITLARRPDRKANFLNRNAAILPFLDLKIVDAVDGENLDINQLTPRIHPWNIENLNDRKLRGYTGNGLSHLSCLDKIAGNSKPFGMIFEDDALLFNSMSARIFSNLLKQKINADLIFMNNWARGASRFQRYVTRVVTLATPLLSKPILSAWDAKFEKTTEAYIISARYAEKIANLYRNNLGAFDEHLRAYTQKLGVTAFYCRPAIFKQNNRKDSDVQL